MNWTGIATAIDRFTEVTGRAIAWLTLAMVLVGVGVVIMRYALSIVFTWMQESQTYMHAAVFAVGAAYALLHDDHVRIDIFYGRMSAKVRAWINLLGTVFFVVPLGVLLLTASWQYVLNSWAMLEGSQHMRGIPAVFILKTLIWVFAGGLLLQSVSVVLRNLATLVAGAPQRGDADDSPPGTI